MRVSSIHVVEGLASGLYETPGQCLMELVRNSLVASMPPNVWKPKQAKIEISLVRNHPLAPRSTALVVLDHGCGLTDPMCERYCEWLGTPLSELGKGRGSHNGASQKGIGRLAALALNAKCIDGPIEERVKHGYYLFSRTSEEGKVRFLTIVPAHIESEGGFKRNVFISQNSTELGSLKGIKGSFTAIVIPTPIFESAKDVYEAIKWHLPREQDKMFELWIDGQKYGPPPLEQKLTATSTDGAFRARLNVSTTGEGAWLCDAETGIRVGSCVKAGKEALPDPIWFPELSGDIFIPGLLKYQNTARSAVVREYFRRSNKEYEKMLMFLVREVVPIANAHLEKDTIESPAAKTLNDVVQLFYDQYGVPPMDTGPVVPPVNRPRPKPPVDQPSPTPHPHDKDEKEEKEKIRRDIAIKVQDEIYYLYRGNSLQPYIFAQIDQRNSKIISVNVRGRYQAMPEQKVARCEHVLMQILMAIGRNKFPTAPDRATMFANQRRSDFLAKKK